MENLKSFNADPNVSPRWYAAYTRSRFEKRVAHDLEVRQVEYFLPLLPQVRQWKDRKKVVQMPMFPGYAFVHIRLKERLHVLRVDGVVRLVGFNGQPSPIPDHQIERVKRLFAQPELVEPAAYVEEGDLVEITHGPFSGVAGTLVQRRGQRRLLVCIDIIQQAVSVEVDIGWVKPLNAIA